MYTMLAVQNIGRARAANQATHFSLVNVTTTTALQDEEKIWLAFFRGVQHYRTRARAGNPATHFL